MGVPGGPWVAEPGDRLLIETTCVPDSEEEGEEMEGSVLQFWHVNLSVCGEWGGWGREGEE